MDWKIGHAKQRLSELIRAAEKEPQVVLNRDQPVAVVVGVEVFREFDEWRKRRNRRSIADRFDELRDIMTEEDVQFRPTRRKDRKNAFAGDAGAR